MMREVLQFVFFLYAIAKVLAMTGLGLGVAIAVFAERCGFRVVSLGVEKVSGERQLAQFRKIATRATSLSRKVKHA